MILAGRVLVTGPDGHERKVEKAGERLDAAVSFRLKGDKRAFVSRAGAKLAAALEQFEIRVRARICLDLGLSTGGFSDCLLQQGAERIHGVDVAYGIVDWRIRQNPRMILYERTNARHLKPEDLGEKINLAVIDLSFIGLSAIWPVLPHLLTPNADVVALVKPQFELAKNHNMTSGIVTDPETRLKALQRAENDARRSGLHPVDACPSPVLGRNGNQEWLLHLRFSKMGAESIS